MGFNLNAVRLCDWVQPRNHKNHASLVFVMVYVSVHDSIGVVRPCLSLQHFRQPLALGVGVVPEVEEKEQEDQAVQANDVDKDGELVWAVLDEKVLGDVGGNHDKLDLRKSTQKKVDISIWVKGNEYI